MCIKAILSASTMFTIMVCTRRDDARTVLVAMVAELGPKYLHFAIDTLRSALPQRGYMGHVLGYTLHSVLAALMQVCSLLCSAKT
jgi:U3 small nucleolar RNA-associated protein 20